MPLFSYQCSKCGHIMELLEKSDTVARHTCEKCGSDRVSKMVSAVHVNIASGSSGSSCPTGTCPLS